MDYDLAKHYLKRFNSSILIKNHLVLQTTVEKELPEYKAQIILGQDFLPKELMKMQIVSLEDAKELGFLIVYKDTRQGGKWLKPIVPRKDTTLGVTKMGNNIIEYDPYEKGMRVKGPNSGSSGVGDWVYIHSGVPESELKKQINHRTQKPERKVKYVDQEDMMNKRIKGWFTPEVSRELAKELKLKKDVPVMITTQN